MDQSRTYYRLNRVTTVDEDGSTRTFTFTSFDINLWSHSTAFTTTATGVLRNPGQNPENIGPLTQVWQEPNWCSSQWYSEGTVAFYSYGTGPNPTSTIITSAAIWSTQPTSLGSRYSNFISCQPYSQRNFFPGICPDQYSVAEVTQWYIEWATGGTETQWDATCCRSYVLRELSTKLFTIANAM